MTTVGYGDKAPITVAGRLLAIIWMFTSLLMISVFTASVASLLLADRLDSRVSGLKDLPHVHVASIRNSTSEAYLRRQRIRFRPFETPLDALQALKDGNVDAVVYDAPMLRYKINEQFRDELAVLPIRFETQNYGIGLPTASELREPVNQSLLRVTSEPDWQDTLYRYLGE
jgi:ABC-type amino acid transport substrate-binding protein